MIHEPTVVRRRVEILNGLGFHMRPATKFVKLALKFQADVRVIHNGARFNGKSVLDLTTLAAERGTHLEIEARGADAEAAVAALSELVDARFHEDDGGAPIGEAPIEEAPIEQSRRAAGSSQ